MEIICVLLCANVVCSSDISFVFLFFISVLNFLFFLTKRKKILFCYCWCWVKICWFWLFKECYCWLLAVVWYLQWWCISFVLLKLIKKLYCVNRWKFVLRFLCYKIVLVGCFVVTFFLVLLFGFILLKSVCFKNNNSCRQEVSHYFGDRQQHVLDFRQILARLFYLKWPRPVRRKRAQC